MTDTTPARPHPDATPAPTLAATFAPTLAIRSDRGLVRAIHHSTRYLAVEVTAPTATATSVRPRVNVAFVLDRSGSMGGRKIELARDAVRQGIARLAHDDRFAVVAYDHEIDVIAAGRPATGEGKSAADRAIAAIEARGNTNLGGGWLSGAQQVAEALDPAAVNRVLLLTDGLANQGITNPSELTAHAAALRARGVSTSTFGVGEDFDEALLGAMADAGGGSFRFIGSPADIPTLIAAEVGELLEVTARGVQLRFATAGPANGIQVEPIGAFAFEPKTGGGVVHLGDLVSDQVVRLVVALTFPMGEVDRTVGVELALVDADGRVAHSETLTWRYADTLANDGQPRDREVDRLVARAYADRALRDVVALNRRGELEQARHALRAVAQRIRGYAGRDEVLRGIVDELEREAERWSVMQEEGTRKLAYSASAYRMKSRMAMGAPMRRDSND